MEPVASVSDKVLSTILLPYTRFDEMILLQEDDVLSSVDEL